MRTCAQRIIAILSVFQNIFSLVLRRTSTSQQRKTSLLKYQDGDQSFWDFPRNDRVCVAKCEIKCKDLFRVYVQSEPQVSQKVKRLNREQKKRCETTPA